MISSPMRGAYRPWISSYGIRVGYASCITRTASITPAQRSWSRTIGAENNLGFSSMFGLMQRMKQAFVDCSSASRAFRSVTNCFATERNAPPFLSFCDFVYSSSNMVFMRGTLELFSDSSHSLCSVSLFLSSQGTSCWLVAFAIISEVWYTTSPAKWRTMKPSSSRIRWVRVGARNPPLP